ncbi:TPA: phage antirepressor KilAC domain-containing protein [Providencia alcalifaciens]|uniref:phage antirepressor KilAC domain-containing protein n=1 Tax=Providencia sp. PROV209 TaxID=2949906 RepID=UPI0012B5D1C4|nr:phage antirepressor KilAC domain-containing protein [Providencia sp. PROV209]MTC75570.1 phage regulatory protein/antirepressor Ant [Providencia sp. wls1919]
MNQLAIKTLTMSSVEISELVESRHDKVKQSIERLAARGAIQLPPMGEVRNHQNQVVQVYQLNKRDSYVVVAQLSPEFTARLVDRWQELENQKLVPTTFSEALRLAADLEEEKQQLENKLIEAAPKVEFVDRYVSATGAMTFRQVCKLLDVKEPEFRGFLLDKRIMYRLNNILTPYQQHLDAGRFEMKTGVTQGTEYAFAQARFTAKGVNWIAGQWMEHKAYA